MIPILLHPLMSIDRPVGVAPRERLPEPLDAKVLRPIDLKQAAVHPDLVPAKNTGSTSEELRRQLPLIKRGVKIKRKIDRPISLTTTPEMLSPRDRRGMSAGVIAVQHEPLRRLIVGNDGNTGGLKLISLLRSQILPAAGRSGRAGQVPNNELLANTLELCRR